MMFGTWPNIIGTLGARAGVDGSGSAVANVIVGSGGAFYDTLYDGNEYARVVSTESNVNRLKNNSVPFDSSRSSSIYNGTTVQCAALSVLPCIRC